jgi:hypothetical protein
MESTGSQPEIIYSDVWGVSGSVTSGRSRGREMVGRVKGFRTDFWGSRGVGRILRPRLSFLVKDLASVISVSRSGDSYLVGR